MAGELKVCYISNIDGARVPFLEFPRAELPAAIETTRRLGHSDALCARWVLLRNRKVIARIPRPRARKQEVPHGA